MKDENGHDPFETCYGCPPTRKHPGCTDTCLGKAFRKAVSETRRIKARQGLAWVSDEEREKRVKVIQATKYNKRRR